jgi:hypothetical protein
MICGDIMRKVEFFAVPLLLFTISLITFISAVFLPQIFVGWYPGFIRETAHIISIITGFIPFSLGELCMYGLPVVLLVYIITAIKRHRKFKFVARTLLTWAGALMLSFIWLYGIVYFCPTPGERMGLAGYTPSARELLETAEYYRDLLNNSAVERGDDSRAVRQTLKSYNDSVINGYNTLALQYDFIKPKPVPSKGLMLGVVQSYLGISGIYIPWFAEGLVNTDTPPQHLPLTIAHELAHRQGVGPEDEANFLGILACLYSGDPNVEYSGAFRAFTYLSNALSKADPAGWSRLWAGISEPVRADFFGVREHYEQFEGPINEIGERVNDAYLKVMQQEAGVQSYGMVVDLLVAYHKK